MGIPAGDCPHFLMAKAPMQLSSLMAILQRGDVPKRELFMVTTGEGNHPAGLSVLDALCTGFHACWTHLFPNPSPRHQPTPLPQTASADGFLRAGYPSVLA